jgi:UDP-2-acetamido-3-amino-2,3-dideoxy-glucuronate N-acetyltransferase
MGKKREKEMNTDFSKNNGYKTITTNIIHESFKFGTNVKIGNFCVIEEDVIVGDNVDIQNYVLLRKGTRIGNNCYVDSYFRSSGDNDIGNNVTLRFGSTIARKVKVGDSTFISPNVMTVYSLPDGTKSDGTIIQPNCFIGTAAVLTPNIEIVEGCIIGANTFVNKSCMEKGIYAGNPAKQIRKL